MAALSEHLEHVVTEVSVLKLSLLDTVGSMVDFGYVYVSLCRYLLHLIEFWLVFAHFWGISLACVTSLPGFTTCRIET